MGGISGGLVKCIETGSFTLKTFASGFAQGAITGALAGAMAGGLFQGAAEDSPGEDAGAESTEDAPDSAGLPQPGSTTDEGFKVLNNTALNDATGDPLGVGHNSY